jgi:hypothetical protein
MGFLTTWTSWLCDALDFIPIQG